MADKKEDDLSAKYAERLREELEEEKEIKGAAGSPAPTRIVTSDYLRFKRENLPKHLTLYERFCKLSEKIVRLNPPEKSRVQLQKDITLCHLEITPQGAMSLSVIASLLFILITLALSLFVLRSNFLTVSFLFFGLIIGWGLSRLPSIFANNWRLKSSGQMIQCIFYMVTYMRHTSNLERAVEFAAQHLTPPLSIDLKKVLWDVETQKYGSIKESLDVYLENWRDSNREFIESFQLLEGSLYEAAEERRLTMIEKSLSVMLEETYEKMLRYTHDLKGPITMLYMLGIILPILGLVILPLVVSFMTKDVNPLMIALIIAVLYNLFLPAGIYFIGRDVLSKRPTGYGETDISEEHPQFRKYRNIIFRLGKSEFVLNPLWVCVLIGGALAFAGLLPILLGLTIPREALLAEPNIGGLPFKVLGYKISTDSGAFIGPYGLVAAVISILVTVGVGLGLGLYFSFRSSNVIRIRENAKRLEEEFASALFQLGNRLGDNEPAEAAVGHVASLTEGTTSGDFFAVIDSNIRKLGMSLENAIFNPLNGALSYYPSKTIESSMRIFVDAVRKGPKIASQAIINVSEYIKDIHRVNERLQDLMAEIISDMKQQVSFLAPAISAIVVGITSMIITILGSLSEQFQKISASVGGAADTSASIPFEIGSIFGDGVPSYYFQIIVGIYIVQIVYILTVLINGIQNGSDKLSERYSLGKNLISSTLLYAFITLVIMIVFNLIAGSIIGGITATAIT